MSATAIYREIQKTVSDKLDVPLQSALIKSPKAAQALETLYDEVRWIVAAVPIVSKMRHTPKSQEFVAHFLTLKKQKLGSPLASLLQAKDDKETRIASMTYLTAVAHTLAKNIEEKHRVLLLIVLRWTCVQLLPGGGRLEEMDAICLPAKNLLGSR